MKNIDEAIEALLAYQQADMEGVMVLTSRQAIHEVADELRRMRGVAQRPKDPKDPAVVAAVQEALMRHPFWKPGLGSSGFAFGLANTAIDAYTLAMSSTQRGGSEA